MAVGTQYRRSVRIALASSFAMTAFASSRALAQTVASEPYVWKPVTVRAGGYIPGIEFSPVQKNLAYCRTDIGGPYKWDQPSKRWLPLLDWCGTYNYFGSESIAPDPVDPLKVYIACGMYGRDKACIMRSSDGGKTFQITEVPCTMGGNENGRGAGERLAVDPNDTSILYFGSRHDGLWKSVDGAVTWAKVENFPGKINGRGTGGLSFVLFNPASSPNDTATKEIYVGNTERGSAGLYRSKDAGETWEAVGGEGVPPENLFPTHGAIDGGGTIWFAYSNSIPPSGASDGGIYRFDTTSSTWTNVTPLKPNADGQAAFGYGNVSVDRQHPGVAICSTLQRDTKPGGDDLLRTVDGGKTWKSVNATPGLHEARDVSAMPYLKTLANPPQWFGWWMTAVAIDPFDSDHACYATGATIYNTNDISQMELDKPSHWNTWVEGIEETANLYLCSPTDGPHLISAFGDIGGFVHEDLDQTPAAQFLNPKFGNGQAIEYAGKNPKVIVRNGTPSGPGATAYGYSEDFGKSWQPLNTPAPPPATQPIAAIAPATQPGANGGRPNGFGGPGGGRGRGQVGFGEGTPALIVSADGGTFMLLSPSAQISRDRGLTWTPVKGLPGGARAVADRVDANKFYALDIAGKQIFTSTDGGVTFSASPSVGLPDAPQGGNGGVTGARGGGAALHVWQGFDRSGDLWAVGGRNMLHSLDGGKTFTAIADAPAVASNGRCFGLGKAAPGKEYPAIFVGGTYDGVTGMFRSDDVGQTWKRINDDQHQYGLGMTALAGDPRVYGRMYVGFNGRGIVYGDVAK